MFTEIDVSETYTNEDSWTVLIFIPFLFPFCPFPNAFYSQQHSQHALKLSSVEKECFVKSVARVCPHKGFNC